ncbi:MAG: PIN domain-containing protein [Actinobacteria bacterium]|nr:PIN domain-containing protein [Actinomycetota bacterium]MCG2819129.1 PIN domain-containing protein [Actinomycetes bacterium]MBU4179917.1 PIN domain-containing protein [Actinomycetota bacterium]MBU4218736.1 PIN domain-containing protein [Actinomycetota bacterium]MBU4359465.1 PIN domain-containing protein [Actinomycetota bacterium]
MRFLETDAILRYLTRDDEKKAAAVLTLLRKVESGRERVVTSPMVIFEVVFTLQSYYKVPKSELREKVLTILDLRGLSLEHKDVFAAALECYCDLNLPFADAFNACYMKSSGLNEIYTYDEDYERIDGIKRVAP